MYRRRLSLSFRLRPRMKILMNEIILNQLLKKKKNWRSIVSLLHFELYYQAPAVKDLGNGQRDLWPLLLMEAAHKTQVLQLERASVSLNIPESLPFALGSDPPPQRAGHEWGREVLPEETITRARCLFNCDRNLGTYIGANPKLSICDI